MAGSTVIAVVAVVFKRRRAAIKSSGWAVRWAACGPPRVGACADPDQRACALVHQDLTCRISRTARARSGCGNRTRSACPTPGSARRD